jgi:hypothetical protein
MTSRSPAGVRRLAWSLRGIPLLLEDFAHYATL